jgi:hypothetical protein
MRSILVRAGGALAAGLVAVASPGVAAAHGGAVDWPQWGQNAQHQGAVGNPAQSLQRALANVTYDPFVDQERVDGGGSILVHYQTRCSRATACSWSSRPAPTRRPTGPTT